ncbi:Fc.00g030900.m01.CDS01 [Cosmosporella sp. VM-42]
MKPMHSLVSLLGFALPVSTGLPRIETRHEDWDLSRPTNGLTFERANAVVPATADRPTVRFSRLKKFKGKVEFQGHSITSALSRAGHRTPEKGFGHWENVSAFGDFYSQYAVQCGWDGKPVWLLFDTGSSDTWAVKSNFHCVDSVGSRHTQQACGFGSAYIDDFGRGEIDGMHFFLQYGDGEKVSGPMGYSDLSCGGLFVSEQQVGLANKTFWNGNNVTVGLLGLAYPSITSGYYGKLGEETPYNAIPYTPFLTKAIAQGSIDPLFSVAIVRNSSEGVLAWGGLPPIPFKKEPVGKTDLIVANLVNKEQTAWEYSYYTIIPDGFKWGLTTDTTKYPFIVDTGTSMMFLPPPLAEAIAATFRPQAVYLFQWGQYFAPCDSIPPRFGVVIGGVDFWINPVDMISQRYLQWLSIPAQTFNVGNYRRNDAPQPTADFFDTNNAEGERKRRAAAEAAVADMLAWFRSGGVVGIFDATNSTQDRRRWIRETCSAHGVETLFVESKCDDEALIMANIRDVKTTSPDYRGQDPEAAALDFRNRIRNYEKVYRTIDANGDEADLTYLKIMDVGKQVIISRIQDYLQSRIVYYLMNLHIRPRSVWLSRHGESLYNLDGRIGGDTLLSPRGEQYARKLPELVRKSVGDDRPLTVWTSTLRRTIATSRFLPPHYNQLQWKALDELDSGVCDGLTYQEIKDRYPEDFAARDEDKYNYRYRGGESYRDVVIRLEPIIMELERSEDILIVTHQAVLRCIYAYFMKKDQAKSPWMNVPLHTLIKLTPRAYGTDEVRYEANIPAVSTWRGKGSTAKHENPVPESL